MLRHHSAAALVPAVAMTLLLAAVAPPSSLPAQALPDSAVHAAIAEWVAMWNRYDLTAVDSLFLADDRVTYFSSEREGLISGIAAVRRHHESFGFVPGGKTIATRLWVDDVRIVPLGATIVVGGVWYFDRGEVGRPAQRGPVTIVYLREARRLRIAHMHFGNYP